MISKCNFIIYNIWLKMGHFLVILNTSGSRGFELQVRVWSGLTILQKLGFGFVGFHFQTSCFRVSRFQSRLSSLRLGLHIPISVGSGSEIFGFRFAPETFKMWKCWNLIILLPLRFFVKSNFSKFKRSKNVLFGNFRDA